MKRLLFYLFVIPFSFLFAYEGLDYHTFESCALHVLEVDPNLFEIKPVKALDNGIGRESVLSLAERHGALAAVNGGFFAIGGTLDGKACGALKINEWIALPFKPRGCIGWDKDAQKPLFDRLLVKVKCEGSTLNGLNRERKEGEAILFTPSFSRTTLTYCQGKEIVIENGQVESVIEGQGSAPIPSNGAVLSLDHNSPLYHSFEKISTVTYTMKIKPQTKWTKSEEWDTLPYIVGGTPLLVIDGKQVTDVEKEQTIPTFITNRHARTAVGLLPNGHWLFVVVDKGYNGGMTIEELATTMLHFGCVAALNLDGGGSSTMIYDHVVVNAPQGDEDEGQGEQTIRRVSDAIVIVPRKPKPIK